MLFHIFIDKCNVVNGGCQHNCDHIEDGTVVCTCREDFRLQQDGKSCEGSFDHIQLNRLAAQAISTTVVASK